MTLATLWYLILAAMLIAYVVLDGFDLGAGIVHLVVARDERERAAVRRAIGPFWDGNEVWLIAAGGVLLTAFPRLYAAAFSGFYLALMLFLWLLILRGLSLELRGLVDEPLWRGFWDKVFGLSSLALAALLGIALGNIVRGVDFGSAGGVELPPDRFFTPLWDDLLLRGDGAAGLLDLFTAAMGATAVATLALHGAAWVRLKTEDVAGASGGEGFHLGLERFARRAWRSLVILIALTLAALPLLRTGSYARFFRAPLWLLVPAAGLVALALQRRFRCRGSELAAFLASSVFLASFLAATAIALHPILLPSRRGGHPGLTIADAASPEATLAAALRWWPLGAALAAVYFVVLFRIFRGKLSGGGEDGYGAH